MLTNRQKHVTTLRNERYLQSPLPAVHHRRSALHLAAQDAVQLAVADWLLEHGLQLLCEPLPLSDLNRQLTGEEGHAGPELL